MQAVVLADWKGKRSRKSELGWRPRDGDGDLEMESVHRERKEGKKDGVASVHVLNRHSLSQYHC